MGRDVSIFLAGITLYRARQFPRMMRSSRSYQNHFPTHPLERRTLWALLGEEVLRPVLDALPSGSGIEKRW